MLWDSRKSRSEAAADAAAFAPPNNDGQIFPTKALRKFLGSLTSKEAPVLLDLGPVVGSNVTFFGERLGCKILIADLFAELDRYTRNDQKPLGDYLVSRLQHAPASVDGILCWNFFDFLDPVSAQAVGRTLTSLVRPDGAALAFFTTVAAQDARFAKYVIMDDESLTQKPYGAGGRKQTPMQNRDVIRLFDGMKVAESFLLKTNVREFLFRKQ